jgi:hypothetical protein
MGQYAVVLDRVNTSLALLAAAAIVTAVSTRSPRARAEGHSSERRQL